MFLGVEEDGFIQWGDSTRSLMGNWFLERNFLLLEKRLFLGFREKLDRERFWLACLPCVLGS